MSEVQEDDDDDDDDEMLSVIRWWQDDKYSVPGEGDYPSFSSLNELVDHYRYEGLACVNGLQIKLVKVCGLSSPWTDLFVSPGSAETPVRWGGKRNHQTSSQNTSVIILLKIIKIGRQCLTKLWLTTEWVVDSRISVHLYAKHWYSYLLVPVVPVSD